MNTIDCETCHALRKIIQFSTGDGSTLLKAVSNQFAFLTLNATNYNVIARQHTHVMNCGEVCFQILTDCNRKRKLLDFFFKKITLMKEYFDYDLPYNVHWGKKHPIIFVLGFEPLKRN